jgi:RHS repeat-associated protein
LTSFALYEAYGTRPYEWEAAGTLGDPDRQKANTKEEESDLGLLNEGMRYRDLETGVFMNRDPIGYGDGPNVYCYVHCNPITHFDALGLEDEDCDYEQEEMEEEFKEEVLESSVDRSLDDDWFVQHLDSPSSAQQGNEKASAAAGVATQANSQQTGNSISGSQAGQDQKNKELFKGATGFSSADDAAKDALNKCNPESIESNREFGGIIYTYKDENGDVKYGYTAPRTDGKPTMVNINPSIKELPEGANIAGYFHTHGRYISNTYYGRKDEDRFSPEDRRTADDLAKKNQHYEASYLGRPDGSLRAYPYNRDEQERRQPYELK